jgi:two-component system CheB/CheR fusion protein
VNIDVEPLIVSKDTDGLLLVAFQEQPQPAEETLAQKKSRARLEESDLTRQLEQELESTREDLQSTIEELESSNEELKASNEEIMSMNEELQSSNEELETSKEELQSLNEELNTVNGQLQEKVHDLEVANNDMTNLFTCTNIPTLFLDMELRIKRFTPATTRLFKLIAGDVGRPIGDIVREFADDDLMRDAQEFLHDLAPREKEVRTEDGRWCARRLVPYRTLDNRIDGIVMTFVDITERKLAADAAVQRLAALVESSADAIFNKDLDGTIRTWNRGAERLYGYSASEAVGQSVRLIVPEDRAQEVADILNRLSRGEDVQQMETERVRKGGQRVPVSLTISPVLDGDGKVVSASVIARDITERKRAEEALREREQRLSQDLTDMARLQECSTRLVHSNDLNPLSRPCGPIPNRQQSPNGWSRECVALRRSCEVHSTGCFTRRSTPTDWLPR